MTTKQRRPVRNTYSSTKILQAQVTLHGTVVCVHDVGDAPVPESCYQLYLNVAGSGRVKQKPTDKR